MQAQACGEKAKKLVYLQIRSRKNEKIEYTYVPYNNRIISPLKISELIHHDNAYKCISECIYTYLYTFICIYTQLYTIIHSYTHLYGLIKFWSKCHKVKMPLGQNAIIAFDQNL